MQQQAASLMRQLQILWRKSSLPGCVMYEGATIFDLVLPKVAADVPVTRADIVALGEGGLCLGCKECRYPICPFGK